jgi:hypothetical protein
MVPFAMIHEEMECAWSNGGIEIICKREYEAVENLFVVFKLI